MKHFTLIIITVATLLSITACSSDDDASATPNSEVSVVKAGDKVSRILEVDDRVVVHRIDTIIARGDSGNEVLFSALHHYEVTSEGFSKLGFDLEITDLDNFVQNQWTRDGRSQQSNLYTDLSYFVSEFRIDLGQLISWFEESSLSIVDFKSLIVAINTNFDHYQSSEKTELDAFYNWVNMHNINLANLKGEIESFGETFESFFKICKDNNISMNDYIEIYVNDASGDLTDFINYILNLSIQPRPQNGYVEAANLAWDIFKASEPVVVGPSTSFHTYYPGTSWTDYFGAQQQTGRSLTYKTYLVGTTGLLSQMTFYSQCYYDAQNLNHPGQWLQRYEIVSNGFAAPTNAIYGTFSASEPINLGTPNNVIPQTSITITLKSWSLGSIMWNVLLTGSVRGDTGMGILTTP